MRKFILIAGLIAVFCSVCGIKTAIAAEQTYTDEEIMRLMRRHIDGGGSSDWWGADSSGWGLSAAGASCYMSQSGTIYTIASKVAKNLSQIYLITRVNLDANSIRYIEGYVLTNPMYGRLVKLKDNEFNHDWQTNAVIVEYCDYLRKNLQKIKGAKTQK